MSWDYSFVDDAKEDMEKLDGSQRKKVIKLLRRVSVNPLPANEGGYGKPLENQNDSKLAGLLKIKLKNEGLRIVYKIIKKEEKFIIIVIGVRADKEVYSEAEKRRKKYNL